MNALQGIDRYRKEVIQVSTLKNVLKVQYLYDRSNPDGNRPLLEFYGRTGCNNPPRPGELFIYAFLSSKHMVNNSRFF